MGQGYFRCGVVTTSLLALVEGQLLGQGYFRCGLVTTGFLALVEGQLRGQQMKVLWSNGSGGAEAAIPPLHEPEPARVTGK